MPIKLLSLLLITKLAETQLLRSTVFPTNNSNPTLSGADGDITFTVTHSGANLWQFVRSPAATVFSSMSVEDNSAANRSYNLKPDTAYVFNVPEDTTSASADFDSECLFPILALVVDAPPSTSTNNTGDYSINASVIGVTEINALAVGANKAYTNVSTSSDFDSKFKSQSITVPSGTHSRLHVMLMCFQYANGAETSVVSLVLKGPSIIDDIYTTTDQNATVIDMAKGDKKSNGDLETETKVTVTPGSTYAASFSNLKKYTTFDTNKTYSDDLDYRISFKATNSGEETTGALTSEALKTFKAVPISSLSVSITNKKEKGDVDVKMMVTTSDVQDSVIRVYSIMITIIIGLLIFR